MSKPVILFLCAAMVVSLGLNIALMTSTLTSNPTSTTKASLPTRHMLNNYAKQNNVAGWDYLYQNFPMEITSVELSGFEQNNTEGKLRLTITDEEQLNLFRSALNPHYMLRFALSDLGSDGYIHSCLEEPVDLIFINTSDKQIGIGIACDGFHLDTSGFNDRNLFFSWVLAKAVDDVIYKETGSHFPDKKFKVLSGEKMIQKSRRKYEEFLQGENNTGEE